MNRTFLTVIHHPITECTLYATETDNQLQIEELSLGCCSSEDQVCDNRLAAFKKIILDYLDGNETDFLSLPLNLSRYTFFQQKVLTTLRAIPRGITISYEDLAYRAGFPGAARAVGSVVRKNRFPLIIPCHRVILKSGKIGGYCGMHKGKMVELKQTLLSLEGYKNNCHIKKY